MPFKYQGSEYTDSQIRAAAQQSNLSIDDYVAKVGLEFVDDSGKKEPQGMGATAGTNKAPVTGSQSANGSLVSLEDDKDGDSLADRYFATTETSQEEIDKAVVGDYFKLPTRYVAPTSSGTAMMAPPIEMKVQDPEELKRIWGEEKYNEYRDYVDNGNMPEVSKDYVDNITYSLKSSKQQNFYKKLSEEQISILDSKLKDSTKQMEIFSKQAEEVDKQAATFEETDGKVLEEIGNMAQEIATLQDKYQGKIYDDLGRKLVSDEELNDFQSKIDAYNAKLETIDVEGITTRRLDLLSNIQKTKELGKSLEKYSGKTLDVIAGIEGAKLNYSIWDKTLKGLEKDIFGNIARYGSTLLKYGNPPVAGMLLEAQGKAYFDKVTKEHEEGFYQDMTWKDMEFGENFGRYALEALGSNALSIGLAALTAGVSIEGQIALKGATTFAARRAALTSLLARQAAAKNLSAGIFFATTAGNRYHEAETDKAVASKRLDELQAKLKVTEGTLEKEAIQEEIQFYSDALDRNGIQMAAGSILYGAAEGLGERLGSLNAVTLLGDMTRSVLRKSGRKLAMAGFNVVKGAGIEVGEETATQIMQNFADNTFFDANKSLIDGIDTDFLAKTIITSVAIGGPTHVNNVYSIARETLTTAKEKKRLTEIGRELTEIGHNLSQNRADMSKKDITALNKQRNKLLREAGLHGLLSLNQLNRLSGIEVATLFQNQARISQLQKGLREIGASKSLSAEYKNKRAEEHNAELTELTKQNAELLGKKSAEQYAAFEASIKEARQNEFYQLKQDALDSEYIAKEEKLRTSGKSQKAIDSGVAKLREEKAAKEKELRKEILSDKRAVLEGKQEAKEADLETSTLADVEVALGTYSMAKDIVAATLDEGGMAFEVTSKEDFQNQLDKTNLSEEKKKELLNKYDKNAGDSAWQDGKNVVMNANLIYAQILAGSKRAMSKEALFAAVAPIHELAHIKARSTKGLINKETNDLNKKAAAASTKALELLEEKRKNGEISQGNYNTLIRRINRYKLNALKENKTEFEEVLNALGDAANLGMITDGDIDLAFEIKSLVNSFQRAFSPSLDIFARMETGKDVLDYIKEFNRKAKKYSKVATATDEEKTKESLSAELEAEIAKIEDRYLEGEIDMETMDQQMANIYKKAELAKKSEAKKAKEKPKETAKPKAKKEATGAKIQKLQETSDKIQKEYDEAMAGVERTSYKRDNPLPTRLEASLTKQFQGKVKGLVSKKFDQLQEEAVQFEDVVANLNIELVALLRTYNPAQGQPLTKYVDQNLKLRLAGVWKNVNKEFNLGLETGDGTTRQIEDTSVDYSGSQIPELEHNEKENFTKSIDFNTKVGDVTLQEHFDKALEKAVKLNLSQYQEQLSKNKTIPAFIEAIRIDMQESLRGTIKQFISEYGYEQFLNDKKEVILSNYTTTYLSKHAPLFRKGVQKSLNGKMEVDAQGNKLFKPNWVSPVLLNNKYEFVDENGKKGGRSTFDRDNAGALGRTSGPEFIRRNPKINTVISTNEFIDYHFQDGAQRKKEKQNPKDALARQIGSEAGLEMFKNDLLNDGPLSQIIETYGPLKGILLESGELRDYAKKVDRGTIKQSAAVQLAISDMLGVNGNTKQIADIASKWYNGLVVYEKADDVTKAIVDIIEKLNPIRNIGDFTERQAINKILSTINREFKVEDNDILYRGHDTPRISKDRKTLTPYGEEVAKKISSALNAAINKMGEEQAVQFIEQFLQYESDSIKRSPAFMAIKANERFFKYIVEPMIKGTSLEGKYELRGAGRNKSFYRVSDGERMNVDTFTSLETTSSQYTITENIENITIYNEEFAGKNLKSFVDTLTYLAEYGEFDIASEYVKIATSSANSSLRKGAPVYLVMDSATKELVRQEQLQLKNDPNYKDIKKEITYLENKRNKTEAEIGRLERLSKISAKIQRNTEFEHAYPASKLAYALLTHLISPSIFTEEKIQEAKKDYWAALVPREVAQQLTAVGAGTTLGGATDTFGRLMLSPTMKRLYDQGSFISYNQDVVKGMKKSIATDVDVKTLDGMVSEASGIEGDIGSALATRLGKTKGKWKFFIPPSADDLMGLMYYMVGKGAKGDADLKFIKEKIIDPFTHGIAALETYKQAKLTEFKKFKKLVRVDGGIKLAEQNSTGFTNEQAVRVYLWTKKGNDVPDITEAERKKIMKYVNDTPYLLEYAKHIQNLFAAEGGYPDVENNWIAGTMTIDILEHINTKARADFLAEYNESIETLFGKFNQKGEVSGPIANKMRAAFGNNYMEALSDVLYRMKHGRARQFGKNRLANQFNNWIANSIGAIMFYNRRSALLQQISFINFINFSDNNPIAFAKAFTNRKQYAKDFTYLFTSDFLKQRRGGLQIDVNEDEIARAAEQGGNSFKNILAVILKKGFTFTTFADSFAISLGGATFYRNRIDTYLKQGMELKEAQDKAFLEFKELTEESQQSSRPDRISQQQASSLGRLILAFANTPMQYARLTKKAALDLINGRGDYKTNISKLLYYGAVQNILFTGLQQGLFSLLYDDDDEDREMDKMLFAANSMVDGFLRGLGFGGAVASVAKNMILEAIDQAQGRGQYDEVIWEALKLSPPIGSKISKARSVARTFMWKQEREKVFNKGWSLDNPLFMAIGQTTSALTNVPLDRVIRDVDALTTPLRQETELWQDIALMLGWGKYELNLIERPKKKSKKKSYKIGKTTF